MAYLVTGGTGYIGSYAVRDLLNAGKEVVCLQRSGVTPTAREVIGEDKLKKIKIIQGDVSNTLQLFEIVREQNIDLIVHIGYTIPPTSEEEPTLALRVNCIGMNNVLEAVRLFGLKRVVWTTSGKAFGPVGEYYKQPIGDDNAIYMPDLMYGATKVLNEFMAKLYFEKFGVDSIGFRLPLVFGVGRYHGSIGVFTEILRKAALNLPLEIPGGNQYMGSGYLYVEDVSALIAKACDVPTTKTRVFNLALGTYPNRYVVEAMRKVNPQTKVKLTRAPAGKARNPSRMDTTGVRTELGWEPKFSLEDGLRKVFNYFRQKEGMSLL